MDTTITSPLTAMTTLSTRALAGVSCSELFKDALEIVCSTLAVPYGLLLEYDPSNAQLTLGATYGWSKPLEMQFMLGEDNPAGLALLSPDALLLNDLQQDARFIDQAPFSDHNVQSGMSVKISGPSTPFGVIGVFSPQQRQFASEEIALLHSIANLLGTTIYRNQSHESLKKLTQQLEREVQARTRLLHLLQDVTITADQAETVPQAMQAALRLICTATNWPLGHVYFRSEHNKQELLPSNIWYDHSPNAFESFRQRTAALRPISGSGLAGKVLATGEVVLRRNLAQAEQARRTEALACGIVDGLAFPVLAEAKIVAVIECFSTRPIELNLSLIEALENIGAQLGRVMAYKQTEQVLRASERRLAQAQHIAQMGSWEWDPSTNQVHWSSGLYHIYGQTPGEFEVTFDSFLTCVHPDDRAQVSDLINRALNASQPMHFTHRIVRPDGSIRIVRATGHAISDANGQVTQMIGTGQDITEQTLAEEKLRAGEELLRRIVMAAPLILWYSDRNGNIQLIEGRNTRMLAQPIHELIGSNIYQLMHDRPDICDYVQRALNGQEIVAVMPSEEETLEVRLAPLRAEDGEVIGVLGLSLNITERMQMENALRASEARFRTIFEGSAVGKVILDLQGKILVTNQALQSMLGYRAADLQGQTLPNLVLPTDYHSANQTYADFFEHGINNARLEQRLLHQDGHIVWGSFTLSWMRKEDGAPWFALLMVEDITKRKQMEAELAEINRQLVMSREAERLHLAQELHDEPLQELYGLMYQLADFTNYVSSEDGLSQLQSAQEAVGRLINELRGICSELRPPALAPFGLEGAIRELAERYQAEHPELTVTLDLMNDDQLLPEHVRLTFYRILQQSLSNITRHAQASQVAIGFQFDDHYARLTIQDNGRGFDVPARWVALVRQGHLGLAGAAERIETVDGEFKVTSAPGQGTLIKVVVPRTGAAEVV